MRNEAETASIPLLTVWPADVDVEYLKSMPRNVIPNTPLTIMLIRPMDSLKHNHHPLSLSTVSMHV